MTPIESITAEVKAYTRELGFDLVGCAPADPFARERELILEDLGRGYFSGMSWITPERIRLACDPDALLPGARSILGLGMAYAHPDSGEPRPNRGEPGSPSPQPSPARGEGILGSPQPSPAPPRGGTNLSPRGRGEGVWGRVARYAQGRDYHGIIRPKLLALAERLTELAGPSTRNRVFVDTGPLVDRAAAVHAGLGFTGKNTCVLTGPHGSYVFLSAILTTVELKPDPMLTKDCGSCTACIDACPTGAIVGPEQLDANRCIAYLTIEHRGSIPRELRPQMEDWLFGCDICQEVCPWNRARPRGVHPEFAPERGAGEALDVAEVLRLDTEAFRARFRGTPLTRPKRAGLLRNAAIVAGNRGDPAVVPALLDALHDPEPVVREHAAWALQRMGSLPAEAITAIETALEHESEALVRAELQEALAAAQAC